MIPKYDVNSIVFTTARYCGKAYGVNIKTIHDNYDPFSVILEFSKDNARLELVVDTLDVISPEQLADKIHLRAIYLCQWIKGMFIEGDTGQFEINFELLYLRKEMEDV